MSAELINILNKEANSISSIKIHDQIIPLTDDELASLVKSIFNLRPELFNDLPLEEKLLYNNLKDDYNILKQEYEDLKQVYDDLEMEYEHYDFEEEE